MRLKGLTIPELIECINEVNCQYTTTIMFNRSPERKGKWIYFTLRVRDINTKFHRRHNTGRKSSYLCWHGHKAVMTAIFNVEPFSILETGWAKYEGQNDFNNRHKETGNRNIGSINNPLKARKACECENSR